MSARFVVIDIGCLECQIDSEMVGAYETREAADSAADAVAESNDYSTQHAAVVFEIPA